MAIALGQSNKGAKTATTGTSQVVSFTGNTTTGSTVVACTSYDSGATTAVNSVTATGMTFTQVALVVAGGTAISNMALWVATNVTGGTTPAVTSNHSGGYIGGMMILELTGAATSSVVDQSTTAKDVSANTAPTATTAATTNANDLILAFAGTDDSGNTYTAGSGFTIAQQQKIGTTIDMGVETKVVAATGTQTGNFTITAASDWGIIVAAFKEAAAGGGPSAAVLSGMMAFFN